MLEVKQNCFWNLRMLQLSQNVSLQRLETVRKTLLCSRSEIKKWSPFLAIPETARFSAPVQLAVKMTFSGLWIPKNSAIAVRTSKTASAAARESLWPLLPGLPPYSFMHRVISLITDGGLGKVVAALSKYIICVASWG